MPNGSKADLEAELARARQDVRWLRRVVARLLRGDPEAQVEAYMALGRFRKPVAPGEHEGSPDPL